MKPDRIAIVLVFALFITAAPFIVFAEEGGMSASAQEDYNTQWAWGEVTKLDGQAKTFTLKYLDYETDQEKELPLAVDEKTAYENINSFDEIKLKDTLSIDYLTDPEGRHIARNISLETPDAILSSDRPDISMSQTMPSGDNKDQ